jgi:quinolinate synthase
LSAELVEKILELKAAENAVILAHNYQIPEVQDIADFTGDSLGLSMEAAATDADTIVFCGVLFMAETAAILSPQKTVLLPEKEAGCPLADMVTAPRLQKLKDAHPDALVVCYVNSPAEVKAISDYCCTSSNAVELVRSLPQDKKIIFVPDKNLGQFVIDTTGRNMILWPGYCATHVRMTADDVQKARADYPHAAVIVHPECTEEVKQCADHMLSTGQMLKFAKESDCKTFIIGTETGIIHALKKQNPDKEFIPLSDKAICPNMKKITLEKILWSLEDKKHKIAVSHEISVKAKASLDRMLQVLPGK